MTDGWTCPECGYYTDSPGRAREHECKDTKPAKLWGVYKANKSGEICDSQYLWYFDSENDARAAVEKMKMLQEDDGKDQCWAPHPGWEFRAYWTYEKVEPKVINFEQFMDNIEEGTFG